MGADQALREVARRLLEERLDPSTPAMASAWAGMATYLDGRIQGSPDQKPGRTPDMSAAAWAAMTAVLREVGGLGGNAAPIAMAAASHPHAARLADFYVHACVLH